MTRLPYSAPRPLISRYFVDDRRRHVLRRHVGTVSTRASRMRSSTACAHSAAPAAALEYSELALRFGTAASNTGSVPKRHDHHQVTARASSDVANQRPRRSLLNDVGEEHDQRPPTLPSGQVAERAGIVGLGQVHVNQRASHQAKRRIASARWRRRRGPPDRIPSYRRGRRTTPRRPSTRAPRECVLEAWGLYRDWVIALPDSISA